MHLRNTSFKYVEAIEELASHVLEIFVESTYQPLGFLNIALLRLEQLQNA